MGEMTLNAARTLTLKALSAGIVLAWSLPTHALNLGKFQVQSAMGEPLRAEVEVTQFKPDELRSLQAQLASPASFRQAGMEFNSALNGLLARLENRADGRPFIVLTGRSPVQESFIDLILEAQWSTGRVVKNYALLLNSVAPTAAPRQSGTAVPAPISSEVIASPVALPPASIPKTSTLSSDGSLTPSSVEVNANQIPVYRFESTPAAPPAPMPIAVTTVPAGHTPSPEVIATQGVDTLTVRPGDTALNLIMGRLPANISTDQMLLALVRANPNAFIEGNVNLVRSGAVLRMPKPSEAGQISRTEARQTVIAQNRDFAAYARRVAESPLLVASTHSREMSGTITTPLHPETPVTPKQDKLTLSKAQVGDSSEEAKLAVERETKDAADQLEALHKNMQELEALAKEGKTETPTLTTTAPLPAPVSSDPSPAPQFGQDKSIWAWVIGAVLAIVAWVVWNRKQSSKSNEIFAPSYDDVPSAPAPFTDIPPQMAEIDLELNTQPIPDSDRISESTAQSKLTLAGQLLASGDKELARTLLMSVASSAHGGLKSRAQQMLGQIA